MYRYMYRYMYLMKLVWVTKNALIKYTLYSTTNYYFVVEYNLTHVYEPNLTLPHQFNIFLKKTIHRSTV
jgi:hypothetical protein